MADTTVVVEGKIKFRDGKKWKPRWCVMKKPSPVADRLQVLLYKDVKEAMRDGGKPKSVFPLEGFYGIESFQFDKEANVMALVCQKQVTLLAYESRENMIQFEIKIRRSLGQEHQFPVRLAKVPHNSRLPLELIRLHIHGQKFCMTAYIPPKILQSWQICDLRRFGSVDGKFCFEGGSKCGRGMGIHVALSEQADEIASIVQQASQGKQPSCHSNINKRITVTETASGSSPHSAKCCDTQNLHYSALVVSVDDLNDKLDAISVSSHESSDNHSIRSEDTVRSSPASTILRPRSGRDYQFVERRHTASESCTSSPQTPYSPSSGTVFSFESTMSNSSHGEEYNAYMNVDMTPGAKDSVLSHKHVSDHEVSPERTLREKLISERDRRSSEREKVIGERNRLNSERDRINSDKEHLHSPRNNLKGDKNQLSPERDKIGQTQDKQDVDLVLNHSDMNCESPEKVISEIDRLCSDKKASGDKDTSHVEEGDIQDDIYSGSEHSPSCNKSASSPPLSPCVPISPIPPEQVNPQLNYAEIDLSTACAAASPTETKRKPKKTVPTTPIAYATIDMLATHAVKQAGIEHAQSREDSLRRSVSVCTRKNSTPLVKDRKYSMRERKMSTGSLGDT